MQSKRRIGIACLLVALSAVVVLSQSEGDKRRNATTGAPERFDGRRWLLDHKALGRRVETVAELGTLALDDGDEALLLGYAAVGDAGKPVSVIYRATGRPAADMFHIHGPGADDYWEFSDQSVADARWAGCVADYSYPSGGTDNTASFNALFAAASGIKVVIPPGSYRITDTITVANTCDLDASQANLVYTAGAGLDRHVLDITANFSRADIELPSVDAHWGPLVVPIGSEDYAAIKFSGQVFDSDIFVNRTRRAPIGLLLNPTSGSGIIAYNRFYGGSFSGCRTGIEIRGEVNVSETGWCNENTFYAPNLTTQSDSQYAGSNYGVKLTRSTGGYLGNNNRFYSPCFQVGGYTEATHNIDVSDTPTLNYRYTNRNNDLGYGEYAEYVCTTVGSGGVATVPTHTSGEVVDGNGYGFTYVGRWWKVPVYHANGSGSFCKFEGCRWEYGDGPFALIERNSTLQCRENEYEFYAASNSSNTRASPAIRQLRGGSSVNYSQYTDNYIRKYGLSGTTIEVVENVHLKAIRSASGWTIAGMTWRDYFNNNQVYTLDENIKLCVDALYFSNLGSQGVGIVVSPNGNDQFEITCEAPAYSGQEARGYVQFWDASNSRYQITGNTDYNVAVSYGTLPNTTYDFFTSQAGQNVVSIAFEKTEIARVSNVFNSAGYMQHIKVRGNSYRGTPHKPIITDWFGESSTSPLSRKSAGTPTVGAFPLLGEIVTNISASSGQPVGYRVTTAGHLAPAWVTATAYVKGELVENAGKIYWAEAAGTSGATAPTHSSGAVSDGTISWRYLGPEAVIAASSETYP